MASKSLLSDSPIDDSPAPGTAKSLDLDRGIRRHLGVQDTKKFLADIGGRCTHWPLLIVISLLAVFLIGYSASRVMFDKGHISPAKEQVGTASSGVEGSSEDATHAVEMQSKRQRPTDSKWSKKAFSFSFQAEAEAAVEHDSSADLISKESLEKSKATEKARLYAEVHDLLESVSEAVRGENLESFLSLMDENEETFVRRQKLKVKMAFRQFDEIDGKYTDVKIEELSANEVAVNLHCKVDAAYSKSGRRMVLFDGDQQITLRRDADAVLKISAID